MNDEMNEQMNEWMLRKAIQVLAHAYYFSLSLPVNQGLLNFDQAAGTSYYWSIYGSNAN